MPPYIDVIAGLFSATVMRKKDPKETRSGNAVNVKGSNPLNKNPVTKTERRYNNTTTKGSVMTGTNRNMYATISNNINQKVSRGMISTNPSPGMASEANYTA